MPYLEYGIFEHNEIVCKQCNWKGLGSELKIDGYSEEHFIIDLSCPNCGEYIGFTQPPPSSKNEST